MRVCRRYLWLSLVAVVAAAEQTVIDECSPQNVLSAVGSDNERGMLAASAAPAFLPEGASRKAASDGDGTVRMDEGLLTAALLRLLEQQQNSPSAAQQHGVPISAAAAAARGGGGETGSGSAAAECRSTCIQGFSAATLILGCLCSFITAVCICLVLLRLFLPTTITPGDYWQLGDGAEVQSVEGATNSMDNEAFQEKLKLLEGALLKAVQEKRKESEAYESLAAGEGRRSGSVVDADLRAGSGTLDMDDKVCGTDAELDGFTDTGGEEEEEAKYYHHPHRSHRGSSEAEIGGGHRQYDYEGQTAQLQRISSVEFDDEGDTLSVASGDEGATEAEARRTIEWQDSVRRSQLPETKEKQKLMAVSCRELFDSLAANIESTKAQGNAVGNAAELQVAESVGSIRDFFETIDKEFDSTAARVTAMIHCCNVVLDVEGLDLLQASKAVSPISESNAQWVIEKLVPHIWGM